MDQSPDDTTSCVTFIKVTAGNVLTLNCSNVFLCIRKVKRNLICRLLQNSFCCVKCTDDVSEMKEFCKVSCWPRDLHYV